MQPKQCDVQKSAISVTIFAFNLQKKWVDAQPFCLKNFKGRALFRKSVNFLGENVVRGKLQIL